MTHSVAAKTGETTAAAVDTVRSTNRIGVATFTVHA